MPGDGVVEAIVAPEQLAAADEGGRAEHAQLLRLVRGGGISLIRPLIPVWLYGFVLRASRLIVS